MKSSFNVFGQANKVYGATSTPVWLGVVSPVPVGGVLASAFKVAGALYPAGTPVNLTNKVITPFISFDVTAYTAGDTYDVVTVVPNVPGFKLEASDNIMKVGATFDAKATGYAVTAVEESNGALKVSIAHQNTAPFAAGDAIAEAAAVGANKSLLAAAPNAYLYNDICFGDVDVTADTAAATGACVRYHGEGILIDRTPAAGIAAACAVAIPGVLQVNG